jgi:CRISPR-associated protein (TIGR03984 family)
MTALYRVPLGTLSLTQALGHVPATGMIALLYPGRRRAGDGPPRCCFARVAAGALTDQEGRTISVGAIYEARVFNENLELRWWQTEVTDNEPRGSAVILHDGALGPDRGDASEMIGTASQHYVLWGRADGSAKNGWSRLTTARIGELWIPLPLAEGGFARLDAREYFATACDGNVIVGDERLIGLSPYVPGAGNG